MGGQAGTRWVSACAYIHLAEELTHTSSKVLRGVRGAPQTLNDTDLGEKHIIGTVSGLGCLPGGGISGFPLPILRKDELMV